jgi:hypothetical protein
MVSFIAAVRVVRPTQIIHSSEQWIMRWGCGGVVVAEARGDGGLYLLDEQARNSSVHAKSQTGPSITSHFALSLRLESGFRR